MQRLFFDCQVHVCTGQSHHIGWHPIERTPPNQKCCNELWEIFGLLPWQQLLSMVACFVRSEMLILFKELFSLR